MEETTAALAKELEQDAKASEKLLQSNDSSAANSSMQSVPPQAFGRYVIHDLELDEMPELRKPLVSACVLGVADGHFSATR